MRHLLVCAVAALLLMGCGGGSGAARTSGRQLPRSRGGWERALSRVRLGATENEVDDILKGLIDHYQACMSPAGAVYPKRALYWLTDDKVWQLEVEYGHTGRVQAHVLSERRFSDLRERIGEELYPHVRPVHKSPGLSARRANPLDLIQAVNALHGLGKERALRVLSRYKGLAGGAWAGRDWNDHRYDLDASRVIPILYCLFVPRDGAPERPPFFEFDRRYALPSDRPRAPLFPPLVLMHDIPFLVDELTLDPRSWVDAGVYIYYCRQHCDLRDKPLSPAVSPVEAAEEIMASDEWQRLVSDIDARYIRCTTNLAPGGTVEGAWQAMHEDMVCAQALRAVSSVCSFDGDHPSGWPFASARWEVRRAAVNALAPRWDAAKQDFVATR